MAKRGEFITNGVTWKWNRVKYKEYIATCEPDENEKLFVRAESIQELHRLAKERLRIWNDDTFVDIP